MRRFAVKVVVEQVDGYRLVEQWLEDTLLELAHLVVGHAQPYGTVVVDVHEASAERIACQLVVIQIDFYAVLLVMTRGCSIGLPRGGQVECSTLDVSQPIEIQEDLFEVEMSTECIGMYPANVVVFQRQLSVRHFRLIVVWSVMFHAFPFIMLCFHSKGIGWYFLVQQTL